MLTDQFIAAEVGFFVGFVTNAVFWKYMLFLRPNVSLSPQVAKEVDQKNGQILYRFKIRNNGKRQAVNVSLIVTLCRLKDVAGGRISSNIGTILSMKNVSALAECSVSWIPWELPPIYIFVAKPNFNAEEELGKPNTRMIATLSVTDAQSGTTHVQRTTYRKEDVVDGDFIKGLSFEIKTTHNST
ncbi:hypothetical protein VU08_08265 [Desulfobulbus sp. F5]|nr:hypothetical protein [Desulfobulbus sp. F5]